VEKPNIVRHSRSGCKRLYFVGACVLLMAGRTAYSQTPPANQVTYTTGTAPLPSSLTSGPYLMFSTPNGLFEFDNIANPTEPNVYLRKGAGQHGLFIYDNNPGDNAVLKHALNLEMYNITNLPGVGTRAGIRIHVDPSNTVPANLYGIEIGNHGPNTTGLVVSTAGTGGAPTSGVGIESLSSGLASFLATEGDVNHTGIPTIGAQFNHYTTGNILAMHQANSAMTGDFIFGNAGEGGVGSLTGNFINFQTNWIPTFRVDASGNTSTQGTFWSFKGLYLGPKQSSAVYYDGHNLVLQPGISGSGNVVVGAGTVIIPAIKANSGSRFVCVDTNGILFSQTTPCSGT
jgi:hypothetical protein